MTLLVVVDPVGLTPAFIASPHGLPRARARQVAVRASLIAFAILAGAALIGDWLLRMLAISLPAFRIAGGLLLFSIASEMVFGVRITRQAEAADKAHRGARAQHRGVSAGDPADGRTRRDHRDRAAGRPRRRRPAAARRS